MKKVTLFFMFFIGAFSALFSQAIRKNHLEMSPTEIADYNSALQLLWASGSTAFEKHMYFANAHGSHFSTNIHSFTSVLPGVNFTSFHRYFLLHWELALRQTQSSFNYLSIPYWDWTVDRGKKIGKITPASYPSFILFSALKESNYTTWGLRRSANFDISSSYLPDSADVALLLSQSSFYNNTTGNFSRELEQNHNGPHVFVGGNMNSAISPIDPVFYSHHAMIDKLWNDWEEKLTGTQSTFPSGASPIPHYSTASPDNWIENNNPDSCANSRYIKFRTSTASPATNKYDVWYAEKGSVILDGANGVNFVASGVKTYRYGAWNSAAQKMEGVIYVGDLKRSGAAAVADNKGGFVVPTGATCEFHAGKEISFKPGAELRSGSTVNAKIVYP